MTTPDFVYTTYIKTTEEKAWNALTTPEFIRQYWGGYGNISDWRVGSQWKHVDSDGTVRIVGEVIEAVPPKRLIFSWFDPNDPSDVSRVTFELQQIEDMVCLKVTHGEFKSGSTMASKVSGGWPRVISSLKSFLETGVGLNVRAGKPDCSATK